MATVNLEKVSKVYRTGYLRVRAGLGRCRRRADVLVGPSGSARRLLFGWCGTRGHHLGTLRMGGKAVNDLPEGPQRAMCSRTTPCTRT